MLRFLLTFRFSIGRFLIAGSFLRRQIGGRRFDRVHLFDAVELMVLRHMLKNQIKFLGRENLHMVLRYRGVIGQYFGNDFCRYLEVLCDLVDPVFKHCAH